MWLGFEYDDVGELNDRIRETCAVTPELFSRIVAISATSSRHPSAARNSKVARIEKLAAAGAWADAAFELIALELPLRQLRRITYDGGEWHCALSRERELPEWLDRSIEARHSDLALALLGVFIEAQQLATSTSRPSVPEVKHEPAPVCILCCDNFA
jgi:hypothetical protein